MDRLNMDNLLSPFRLLSGYRHCRLKSICFITTWVLASFVLCIRSQEPIPRKNNKPGKPGKPPKQGPCDSNPCRSTGARCRVIDGRNYMCVCNDGTQICEGSTYTCDTNPCKNGGSCSWQKHRKHFICHCQENWTGRTCAIAAVTMTMTTPLVTKQQTTQVSRVTSSKVITDPANPSRDSVVAVTTPGGKGITTQKQTTADANTGKEEEWSLHGLSKVDLIGIALPMVVGIPGAIYAFVKICIAISNKRSAATGQNKPQDTPQKNPS